MPIPTLLRVRSTNNRLVAFVWILSQCSFQERSLEIRTPKSLYFCADYHVNNVLKFVTWTQKRASAVKWASLVNRTHINRHILRFKLPVRFKYVESRLLRFANALLAFHSTNLPDERLLRRAAFMQTSKTSQSSFPWTLVFQKYCVGE